LGTSPEVRERPDTRRRSSKEHVALLGGGDQGGVVLGAQHPTSVYGIGAWRLHEAHRRHCVALAGGFMVDQCDINTEIARRFCFSGEVLVGTPPT
jgi:hypothetical protein